MRRQPKNRAPLTPRAHHVINQFHFCGKLIRLIGVPRGPALIDVRTDEEFGADPRLIPGAVRRAHETVASWAPEFAARTAVAICSKGQKVSEGVSAWLRHAGAPSAEVLAGGHAAWVAAAMPLVSEARLPPRDPKGRTVWVTRARPKVDRIACPWLIRRFVDPAAVFLFVAPAEVQAVADRFSGAAFDIEGEDVFWSHRGDLCTFDVMVQELGFANFEPLQRLATIVRGADSARPDLAPEAAGLLAASLGLSRMIDDDLAQLDAGILLYDALFRWARDATSERHDWVSHKPRKSPERGETRS
jgi:rhodanese-related sulfurtransferase